MLKPGDTFRVKIGNKTGTCTVLNEANVKTQFMKDYVGDKYWNVNLTIDGKQSKDTLLEKQLLDMKAKALKLGV